MTTTAHDVLAPPAPGTYTVDPVHTEVGFVARHLVGTKVRGRFTDFTGTLTIADPAVESSFEAEVDAASIVTGVEMRDEHLRSNDFLDIPHYPKLTMKSTKVTRVSDTEWKVLVDLTVRGVTRPVELELEYHGSGPGLQEGTEVAAFSASAEIDRRDWGVNFNSVLAGGGLVVGNRVQIELEVEATRQFS